MSGWQTAKNSVIRQFCGRKNSTHYQEVIKQKKTEQMIKVLVKMGVITVKPC